MDSLFRSKRARAMRASPRVQVAVVLLAIGLVVVVSSVLSMGSLGSSNPLSRLFFERERERHSVATAFTPVEFVRGEDGDDEAWAELADMRWERSDDWSENVGIMKRRLRLLQQMIKSSKALRDNWKRELSQMQPRGIVMSAGGQDQLTNAYASLMVLRKVHQSLLPVVMCHYGDEIPAETKAWLSERITRLEFLDLKEFPFPDYHLPVFDGHDGPRSREDGYSIKLLALRAAPFKEFIYIDADSFPLDNPQILFSNKRYKKKGNIFWPDLWRGATDIYEVFDMPEASPWYQDGDFVVWKDAIRAYYDPDDGSWDTKRLNQHPVPARQTEAGQLVLNKERHWDVLEYLLLLNMHHNITYRIGNMLGDKDTFPAAFGLAGKAKDFYQVKIGPLAGRCCCTRWVLHSMGVPPDAVSRIRASAHRPPPPPSLTPGAPLVRQGSWTLIGTKCRERTPDSRHWARFSYTRMGT